jgi:hypothetical protein
MTKSKKVLMASAALAGLLAGTGASVQASTLLPSLKSSQNAPDKDKGQQGDKDKDKDKVKEKHACKGQNSCKGNGGCGATKGKNDCKGKGECRTDGKPMENPK